MMSPPQALSAPPLLTGIGTDATNSFEDLSGLASKGAASANGGTATSFTATDAVFNPYDALIDACENNPTAIQKAYQTHRTSRNLLWRKKLSLPESNGIKVDEILQELEYVHGKRSIPELEGKNHRKRDVAEIDPRNCLVFWARPTSEVQDLVGKVQVMLKELAPDIWLMPRDNLHMTVLEITHSTTPAAISPLVKKISSVLKSIVNHTVTHRCRLVKPMLSFDSAALAISFVPDDSNEYEEKNDSEKDSKVVEKPPGYTYHHLRRDLYNLSTQAGVMITSRYTVPSAHLTIARFVTTRNHHSGDDGDVDMEKMERWLKRIEKINEYLEGYKGSGSSWLVGEERGMDCRIGALWYGEGETVCIGDGY
ncbi:hypothetical protein RUND412_001695 [Rhizina undulata]